MEWFSEAFAWWQAAGLLIALVKISQTDSVDLEPYWEHQWQNIESNSTKNAQLPSTERSGEKWLSFILVCGTNISVGDQLSWPAISLILISCYKHGRNTISGGTPINQLFWETSLQYTYSSYICDGGFGVVIAWPLAITIGQLWAYQEACKKDIKFILDKFTLFWGGHLSVEAKAIDPNGGASIISSTCLWEVVLPPEQ